MRDGGASPRKVWGLLLGWRTWLGPGMGRRRGVLLVRRPEAKRAHPGRPRRVGTTQTAARGRAAKALGVHRYPLPHADGYIEAGGTQLFTSEGAGSRPGQRPARWRTDHPHVQRPRRGIGGGSVDLMVPRRDEVQQEVRTWEPAEGVGHADRPPERPRDHFVRGVRHWAQHRRSPAPVEIARGGDRLFQRLEHGHSVEADQGGPSLRFRRQRQVRGRRVRSAGDRAQLLHVTRGG